jgi:hypothetical protein
MIALSWVLVLSACSVFMGLLGFWLGRCARKLPIIDDNLPWTLHRDQIPAAAEDPAKPGPSSGRWPQGSLCRSQYSRAAGAGRMARWCGRWHGSGLPMPSLHRSTSSLMGRLT